MAEPERSPAPGDLDGALFGCHGTNVAPIRFHGLDHVVLRTNRLEEVLAFYRDALGCPVERVLEEIGLYQLRAGGALIDVVDAKIWKSEAGPGESLYDHFCLQVASDDVEGLVAELDRVGIPHDESGERYGATGNGWSVYARDPDGRTVELKLVGAEPPPIRG